jgi:hypothetical protein
LRRGANISEEEEEVTLPCTFVSGGKCGGCGSGPPHLWERAFPFHTLCDGDGRSLEDVGGGGACAPTGRGDCWRVQLGDSY